MSNENEALLLMFFLLALVYLIGFVILRQLFRRKYTFPTQIPPPFFENQEELRTNQSCYRRSVGQSEIISIDKEGHSSFTKHNIKEISDREKWTTNSNFKKELRNDDHIIEPIFIETDKQDFENIKTRNDKNPRAEKHVRDGAKVSPEDEPQVKTISDGFSEIIDPESEKDFCLKEETRQQKINEQVSTNGKKIIPNQEVFSCCSDKPEAVCNIDIHGGNDICENIENYSLIRENENIFDNHESKLLPLNETKSLKKDFLLKKKNKKKVAEGQRIFKKWRNDNKKFSGLDDDSMCLFSNKEDLDLHQEETDKKIIHFQSQVILTNDEDTELKSVKQTRINNERDEKDEHKEELDFTENTRMNQNGDDEWLLINYNKENNQILNEGLQKQKEISNLQIDSIFSREEEVQFLEKEIDKDRLVCGQQQKFNGKYFEQEDLPFLKQDFDAHQFEAFEKKQKKQNCDEVKVLFEDKMEELINIKQSENMRKFQPQKDFYLQKNDKGQFADDKECLENSSYVIHANEQQIPNNDSFRLMPRNNSLQIDREVKSIVQSFQGQTIIDSKDEENFREDNFRSESKVSRSPEETQNMKSFKVCFGTKSEEGQLNILDSSQNCKSFHPKTISNSENTHPMSIIKQNQSPMSNAQPQMSFIPSRKFEIQSSTKTDLESTEKSKSNDFEQIENLKEKPKNTVQNLCFNQNPERHFSQEFSLFPFSTKEKSSSLQNDFVPPKKENSSINDKKLEIPHNSRPEYNQKENLILKSSSQTLIDISSPELNYQQNGDFHDLNENSNEKLFSNSVSCRQINSSTIFSLEDNLNENPETLLKGTPNVLGYNQIIQATKTESDHKNVILSHQNVGICQNDNRNKTPFLELTEKEMKAKPNPHSPMNDSKQNSFVVFKSEQIAEKTTNNLFLKQKPEFFSEKETIKDSFESPLTTEVFNKSTTSGGNDFSVKGNKEFFCETTRIDDKSKKNERFFENLQNEKKTSNLGSVYNNGAMSEMLSKEEIIPDSSIDIEISLTHSFDKNYATKNPQVGQYITKSFRQKTMVNSAEDTICPKLRYEEKLKQKRKRETKLINKSNIRVDWENIKYISLADEYKNRSQRQSRISSVFPKDISPEQNPTNENPIYPKYTSRQSAFQVGTTDLKPFSKIVRNKGIPPEKRSPQVKHQMPIWKNQEISKRTINKSMPGLKQVRWLPGYVLPSPILWEPRDTLKILADKLPRNSILKPSINCKNKNESPHNSTDYETERSYFEERNPENTALSTQYEFYDRDPYLWHSQYYDYQRQFYWNDYYKDLMYSSHNLEPRYIYSSENETSYPWERYYSRNSEYFLPNEFLETSASEKHLLSSKIGESFPFEDEMPQTGQPTNNSNSRYDPRAYSDQHTSIKDKERLKRRGKFCEDRYQSSLNEIDYKSPTRYGYRSWFDPLCQFQPRYPKYNRSLSRYGYWSRFDPRWQFQSQYPEYFDEDYEFEAHCKYFDYIRGLNRRKDYRDYYFQEELRDRWPRGRYREWYEDDAERYRQDCTWHWEKYLEFLYDSKLNAHSQRNSDFVKEQPYETFSEREKHRKNDGRFWSPFSKTDDSLVSKRESDESSFERITDNVTSWSNEGNKGEVTLPERHKSDLWECRDISEKQSLGETRHRSREVSFLPQREQKYRELPYCPAMRYYSDNDDSDSDRSAFYQRDAWNKNNDWSDEDYYSSIPPYKERNDQSNWLPTRTLERNQKSSFINQHREYHRNKHYY